MSGYLEVKYPFKSNLGLNPFKSWKRQWCILRPSPTFSGGILAVYCSEAGAAAGTVELPSGYVVRRAKSRTRPHAFAVFPSDEPRKPRILLAATTLHDAHIWMEKIKVLINSNKLDMEGSSKDSYSVTVLSNDLSRKWGLSGADSMFTITTNGVLISSTQKPGLLVQWKHISDVTLSTASGKNGECILTIDSDYPLGGGVLQLWSPLGAWLAQAMRRALVGRGLAPRSLSKSDGHLDKDKTDTSLGEARRTSWYSGPSEVSLDDLDLVMSKEGPGALARCSGAGHLAPPLAAPLAPLRRATLCSDSLCERRSVASVASGIYEEIAELPEDSIYCTMRRDRPLAVLNLQHIEEPQYECVSERAFPPPLPPRECVRSGSLGRLPPAPPARLAPRQTSRQAFRAFRKRLKSDASTASTASSPKSETPKNKDVETKKKKFDFPPTRDIFKSFKVSRKMKNLKINTNLSKGETKSCEFLDETEHVPPNRCSKSVECLEGDDDYLNEVPVDFDNNLALSLPQEIVELIIKGQKLNRMQAEAESDYVPMSPIVPPTSLEHHYIVMSPRTNMA